MKQGFYITGTDTGVGKTVASVALLHALRRRGARVAGMKPVASGCVQTPQGWRNEDALALQAASGSLPAYELVNPFALPAPTAPQIAAALAGVQVTLPPIVEAYRQLSVPVDVMVVEGVGGWLAPLADELEQGQVAAALGLPVILVVGMRLGCLNHARLTERVVQFDGHRLVGWIGCQPDASGPEFAAAYESLLRESLQAPCLGMLPYWPRATGQDMAALLQLPGG